MNHPLTLTFLAFGCLTTPALLQADPPEITHPKTEFVELYNEAWKEAKVRTWEAPKGAPVERYMDENVYGNQIWIWDSCFMAQFTKYAAADYPGIETLEALYVPVVEGKDSPLGVHIYDNPPLFAWCELIHWRFHGDRKRLEDILLKRQLLQRHFAWFANPPTGAPCKTTSNTIQLQAVTAGNGAKGFLWTGGMSGMDNTPRGRDAGGYKKILWVDAISQQALSAKCIARLYADLGRKKEAMQWKKTYDALAKEINDHYWDERDGFYYDITLKDGEPCRVKTIASYWPLMAGVATPERAARALAHLRDPNAFGGERPFPTLARTDKNYNGATGDYWRGGIWLPTAYMTVKAMEQYGARDLADLYAERLIRQMSETFKTVKPATIWECYAPEADTPSTEHGRRARPCFCGWSALGPINLFIENVLGLRDFCARNRTIVWEPPATAQFPMGIENLTFGDTTVSLWTDNTMLKVKTTQPIKVRYQGRTLTFAKGKHSVAIP